MALPASGPISLSMLAAEFGGAAPHGLTEYYRGGAYVPNTPTNAAVAASGTISLSSFHGASATATFTPGFAGVSPVVGYSFSTSVSALIQLRTDGSVMTVENGISYANGQWGSPITANIGTQYWCRAARLSGDVFNAGDAVDTLMPLSSSHWWGYSFSVPDFSPETRSGVLALAVYGDVGGTNLLAYVEVTVEATADGNV